MASFSHDDGSSFSGKLVLGILGLIFLGTLFGLIAVIYSGQTSGNVKTLNSDVEEIKKKIDNLFADPNLPTPAPSDDLCRSPVNEESQFDCHPDPNPDKDKCAARGCCWNGDTVTSTNITCHFPDNYEGYKLLSVNRGNNKIVANLRRWTPSRFRREITQIKVEITFLDESRLRIKITDPNNVRFEPTIPVLNINQKLDHFDTLYNVDIDEKSILTVSRKSTSKILLNIDLKQVIFSDQFLQLSSKLPARSLFGLGEHFEDFKIDFSSGIKRFTMLNGDRPPVEKKPLYGTHPFFVQVEDDDLSNSNSFGVLSFNNHPQDIILQSNPSITYRPIGGIFDFFVYLGSNPEEVVSKHISLVGKPDMPPFWALGWHLCKWGYDSLEKTKLIWKNNRDLLIPFDTMWNDIDYMSNFEDFTYDKDKFAGLPEFVDDLHKLGMHYVPILDPAVEGSDPTYLPFKEGLELDIFVKNASNQLFIGKVWNTNTSIFPDFTNPKADAWWATQLKRFHDQVKYDGIWIDMNEPANFMNGPKEGSCPDNDLENPPYIVGDGNDPLVRKSICMSNKHFIGTHSDVHNMYAAYEARATKNALIAIRKERQFIISRATVTGQGTFGMHWTGDVWSNWISMRQTISSIFTSGLSGLPYVGSDICGFMNDTTVELCTRWSALGAFYPFSRNHNHNETIEQDPWTMSQHGGQSVVIATKTNNELRYSLLPYFYTLFFEATNSGTTVFKPMVYEFPTDKKSYEYVNDQFMWGSGLLFIPILEQGVTKITSYFPPAKWYNFKDMKNVIDATNGGKEVSLEIPLTEIGIYVRGGNVIPMQNHALTTTDQRKNKIKLLVALDNNGQAKGKLFWDDGKSFDTILTGSYNLINFGVTESTLTSTPIRFEHGDDLGIFELEEIKILGIPGTVNRVTLDGAELKQNQDWTWKDNILVISKAEIDMKKLFKLRWV